VLLPGRPRRRVVVTVALAQPTVLLADARETTGLATLVNGVHDPVDACVSADSLVVRVDEDNLVVLVHAVLVDPVRVQHPQVATSPTHTLLRRTPQAALVLEVVHTLADGFTVGGTLGDRLLAVTAADTDTVDNVSLLGLVPQTTSLVGARGAGSAVDDVQLTVLPAPDTEQESENVRLLFLVQLADILVRAHFVFSDLVERS
jgi:hypothetical protein